MKSRTYPPVCHPWSHDGSRARQVAQTAGLPYRRPPVCKAFTWRNARRPAVCDTAGRRPALRRNLRRDLKVRTVCSLALCLVFFLTLTAVSSAAEVDLAKLPASANLTVDFDRDVRP